MTDLTPAVDAIRVIAFFIAFLLALIVTPIIAFLTIRDIWRDRQRERRDVKTWRQWDEDAAQFGAKLGETTDENRGLENL